MKSGKSFLCLGQVFLCSTNKLIGNIFLGNFCLPISPPPDFFCELCWISFRKYSSHRLVTSVKWDYLCSIWWSACTWHLYIKDQNTHFWGGGWASLVAQRIKRLPAMRETRVRSLGWEDPLEKEMATQSTTLAWRIPWTEEPGGLQSTGSQRVGHNWETSLSLYFHLVI